MSGYRWDPVFRVSPVNGSDTYYWLADRLTDLGSHTRIGLTYVESMNVREDVNRSLRPAVFGLRPEVTIECTILSMADQQFLGEIEDALLRPGAYAVFLSLDGGVIYRRVILASVSNASPLAGKVYVGASFVLGLRCVDLIPSKPKMLVDPLIGSELVQDGGMEEWETAAQLKSWTTTTGVLTIAQEATIIRSGTFSTKATRSDSGTSAIFQNRSGATTINPAIGSWYRFQAYAKGSIDMVAGASGPFRVSVYNNTLAEQVLLGGKTVGTGSDLLAPVGVLAASWTLQEGYFRIPSTWLPAHDIYSRFQGYWTGGQSLYYDDVSVWGPILRPGVATW